MLALSPNSADWLEPLQFVELHRVRLLAMLKRRIDPRLQRRIEPEEILQKMIIRARERWADEQQAAKAMGYSWLYRLALDVLMDEWRHANAGKRSLEREMPLPEAASIQLGSMLAGGDPGPLTEAQLGELRERVRTCLALLPTKYREVLWMRHNDDLSYREIGLIVEISEDNAAQRYARGLRKFREMWLNSFASDSSRNHGERGGVSA